MLLILGYVNNIDIEFNEKNFFKFKINVLY